VQAQPAASISGAWVFVVSIIGLPEGVPNVYRSHVTFVPGGGLVQMAWSQRPLALVSTGPWFGYGAWQPTGEWDVALTVVYPRFDEMGTLIGSGKGRGRSRWTSAA
jgi:hypothetical protein